MKYACTVAALLLSGGASAADLKNCAGIADNVQRLACYDRISAEAVAMPASPDVVAAPAATPPRDATAPAPTTSAAPMGPTASTAPTTSTAPATPTAPTANKTAEFGAETVPRAETESGSTLRARLVGTFSGWKQGTVFELDNGQLWKAIDTDDRFEHDPIQAPQVTIEHGLLNYWMKVEGLRRGVKVRRVR